MFVYNSVQTHSDVNNDGKYQMKTNRVQIKGKTGFKMITIRNKSGKIIKKSKKRLTRKQIACIQKCQFIPGLFKDCEICLK
jgi:hypothetical protein